MARPTIYDEAIVAKICERLRAGCTRRAACVSAGISEDTFARWLKGYADFADRIDTSEAECEVRNTAMIERAAFGYDATRTTRTVRTVVKPRKLRFPKGGTVKTTHPDGRVTTTRYPPGAQVEEPVALEEVSEQTSVAFEFDWRAALEWNKRRSRPDWGDAPARGPEREDGTRRPRTMLTLNQLSELHELMSLRDRLRARRDQQNPAARADPVDAPEAAAGGDPRPV